MNFFSMQSLTAIAGIFFASQVVFGQISIDTVFVGNAGNPGEIQPLGTFGGVSYGFNIGRTEVTNTQYVVFLNRVDPGGSNSLGLYDPQMTSYIIGGILFDADGAAGDKYSAEPGREQNPVAFVSWYDSIRFANWLNNGQAGPGTTEYGSYTIGSLNPDGSPVDGNAITRNPGAEWVLPSENEWHKSAYHKNDGVTGNYWNFPTRNDNPPYSDQPPGTDSPDSSNTANVWYNDNLNNGYNDGHAVTGLTEIDETQNHLSNVGAYTNSIGPYGTFDQAGNLYEWVDTLILGTFRGIRGGDWEAEGGAAQSNVANRDDPLVGNRAIGIRAVHLTPEPSSLLLASLCLMALPLRRRR